MLALLFLAHAGHLLRHGRRGGDPFCKTGIASEDGMACCPKYCGACDDQSDKCTGGGEPHKRERACCHTHVTEHERSCDATHPPCALGDEYRNPPAADALTELANTERHAKDDCNEVKQETSAENRLATHFVAKGGMECANCQTKSCTYQSKGFLVAAKDCNDDEACVGFTVVDATGGSKGKPDCLITRFGSEQQSTTKAYYVKVKNQAGATVMRGVFEYHSSEGTTPKGNHAAFKLATGSTVAEVAAMLAGVPPEEAAEILGRRDPKEAAQILDLLNNDDEVQVAESLDVTTASQIIANVGSPGDLLGDMSEDAVVNVIGGGDGATGGQLLADLPGDLVDSTVANVDEADLTNILNTADAGDLAPVIGELEESGGDGLQNLVDATGGADPSAVGEILENTSPEEAEEFISELPEEVGEQVQDQTHICPHGNKYTWSNKCQMFVTGFGQNGKASGWASELKKKGWTNCEISALDKGSTWNGEWGYNCKQTCVCEGVASDKCSGNKLVGENSQGKSASGSNRRAGNLDDQVARLTSAKNRASAEYQHSKCGRA